MTTESRILYFESGYSDLIQIWDRPFGKKQDPDPSFLHTGSGSALPNTWIHNSRLQCRSLVCYLSKGASPPEGEKYESLTGDFNYTTPTACYPHIWKSPVKYIEKTVLKVNTAILFNDYERLVFLVNPVCPSLSTLST